MHTSRLSTMFFLGVLVLSIVFLAGCGEGGRSEQGGQGDGKAGTAFERTREEGSEQRRTAEPTREPTLTADPNPVPVDTGTGTTMIAWDTGDGSVGELMVAVNGKSETIFAKGSKGERKAEWIVPGGRYEFRLYAGDERTSPLASVTVKTTGTE